MLPSKLGSGFRISPFPELTEFRQGNVIHLVSICFSNLICINFPMIGSKEYSFPW
jgi:hypothetical protein